MGDIDKMREALELAEAALLGRNMNMKVVHRKIRAALAQQPAQTEAVAEIHTWTKDSQFTGEPEGHAELIDWKDGIDALSDGVHLLYAASSAPSLGKRAYYETHDAPHCPTCECGHLFAPEPTK